MKAWIKRYFVEVMAWILIAALVFTGLYSWHWITSLSKPELGALVNEACARPTRGYGFGERLSAPCPRAPAAPVINAVSVNAALAPAEVPPFDQGVEVVIDPSGVQYLTFADGRERVFGDASFYDYDLDAEGRGFVCPSRSKNCYTHGKMVAASRHFRRYSSVRVTNLNNGKFVDVKILDYGPDEALHPERVIDLSSSAFAAIAPLDAGIITVRVDWPVPDAE